MNQNTIHPSVLGVVVGARVLSANRQRDRADTDDQGELRETDQSDPEDLAGEQLGRPNSRQEHLDHAAGLLLHDADQDEPAVERDRHEQQHHTDPAQIRTCRLLLRGRVRGSSTEGPEPAAAAAPPRK